MQGSINLEGLFYPDPRQPKSSLIPPLAGSCSVFVTPVPAHHIKQRHSLLVKCLRSTCALTGFLDYTAVLIHYHSARCHVGGGAIPSVWSPSLPSPFSVAICLQGLNSQPAPWATASRHASIHSTPKIKNTPEVSQSEMKRTSTRQVKQVYRT